MKLEEKLSEIPGGVRDLFISIGIVMGVDSIIALPTDYWNGTAPGFDLAVGSGLLNGIGRTLASVCGLTLSMTPELIKFVDGGDYGELSPRALTKGAVYGVISLIAIIGNKLYERLKYHNLSNQQ